MRCATVMVGLVVVASATTIPWAIRRQDLDILACYKLDGTRESADREGNFTQILLG